MKNLKMQFAVLLLSTLSLLTGAHAQITPSADAFTNTADPTTNYGANVLLDVDGATEIAYIQFNLSSIPSGATVSQATLKLYVNAVTKAGTFNVDYVNGTWTESTITSSLAPALGAAIATSGSLATTSKNQYVLINVTSAVQAWLSGSQANDGLALVANSTFNASFDSKENTTTSHPPELDIVFTGGGGGGITGITTASGSGLMGGGSSGTLNLSLTNTCASGQVLEWSGTAWTCATLQGSGTITGVTAGTDLTGGGTSGNVTLNLNTANVPLLSAANTFTGDQTVSGNLSATGVVTGSSYQIGSNLFAFGSYAQQNALLGFAGNSTMTGQDNTASGYYALKSNTSGAGNTASGRYALYVNTLGCCNTASGQGALGNNTTGSFNTAIGFGAGSTADVSPMTYSDNTAVGAYALIGTGTLTNATALGANAVVTESNALVLGSVNGVNAAISNVNVGIGTTAPAATLDVHGTGNFTGIVTVNASSTCCSVVQGNNNGHVGSPNVFGGAGVMGSSQNVGVMGLTNTIDNSKGLGWGVAGFVTATVSDTGKAAGEKYPAGVWGDIPSLNDQTNATITGFGVLATADDNTALEVESNSADDYPTMAVSNATIETHYAVIETSSPYTYNGSRHCIIDTSANLTCSGVLTGVVGVEDGKQKVLYAVESPENWFEDAGSGKLSSGSTRIELDATFAQTVNAGVEYHVFLTPNGDSKGLYASQKTATSFEVHEQGGGTSNIAFDYRIMAKRKGYENARLEDVTEQFKQRGALRQKMQDRVPPSAARQARREMAAPPRLAMPVPPPPRATMPEPPPPPAMPVPPPAPKLQRPPVLPVRAAVRPEAAQPK